MNAYKWSFRSPGSPGGVRRTPELLADGLRRPGGFGTIPASPPTKTLRGVSQGAVAGRSDHPRASGSPCRERRPEAGFWDRPGDDLFGQSPTSTSTASRVVVPNQESERITPSVVLFDGDNVIVGNTAKEAAKVEPHRVVSRVKQNMGDPHFVFEHDGQAYSPEDISSFVLRKVVGDAEVALGGEETITDVVITCPAYFGTDEREATANAGRLAGVERAGDPQ